MGSLKGPHQIKDGPIDLEADVSSMTPRDRRKCLQEYHDWIDPMGHTKTVAGTILSFAFRGKDRVNKGKLTRVMNRSKKLVIAKSPCTCCVQRNTIRPAGSPPIPCLVQLESDLKQYWECVMCELTNVMCRQANEEFLIKPTTTSSGAVQALGAKCESSASSNEETAAMPIQDTPKRPGPELQSPKPRKMCQYVTMTPWDLSTSDRLSQELDRQKLLNEKEVKERVKVQQDLEKETKAKLDMEEKVKKLNETLRLYQQKAMQGTDKSTGEASTSSSESSLTSIKMKLQVAKETFRVANEELAIAEKAFEVAKVKAKITNQKLSQLKAEWHGILNKLKQEVEEP